MWETVRGYLTFTRKERFGVLFLLLLIVIFFILPYFFKSSPGDPDTTANNKMKEEVRKFESSKTDSSSQENSQRYNRQKIFSSALNQPKADKYTQVNMYYFDPNKIQTADWMRLGLQERQARTIRHYLEKGGRFGKAEDLKKLYGLHDEDYERLYPFVRISPSPAAFQHGARNVKISDNHNSAGGKADSEFHKRSPVPEQLFRRTVKIFSETDVNHSDSGEWSRLPGIGEKLASRIIHFRERLGGFYQIDQVAETYGLPDTTFQKIRPYLKIQSASLRQIDINTATREILASHPYIRWALARSIIEYRVQHGSFHSINELLQLAQMDASLFEKLKPYLMAN